MRNKLDGLWLIDSESLLRLDSAIDEECKQATKTKNAQIAYQVKKAIDAAKKRGEYRDLTKEQGEIKDREIKDDIKSRYEVTTEVEITLQFEGSDPITRSRFREFVDDGTLARVTVLAFRLRIRCCGFNCTLAFPEIGTTAAPYSKEIVVLSVPDEDKNAQRMHGRLVQWGEETRAPQYYSWWRTFNGLQWFLVFMLLPTAAIVLARRSHDTQQAIQAQARSLLERGVDDANHKEVTETVLKMLAGTEVQATSSSLPNWYWFLRAYPDNPAQR